MDELNETTQTPEAQQTGSESAAEPQQPEHAANEIQPVDGEQKGETNANGIEPASENKVDVFELWEQREREAAAVFLDEYLKPIHARIDSLLELLKRHGIHHEG